MIRRDRSALQSFGLWSGFLIVGLILWSTPSLAGPPQAHLKEHTITIDATKLVPASWWQVPGVTPSIWNSDPDSLDAPKTSERRALQLKPGKYKFISFTFDFPFNVNLDGTLDFSKSLDQCIDGRGTQVLIVRCKRMYPHGGERDYNYEEKN
jgi:hypothetical protein